MSSLVIVESPAKCSKIAGFLGPGWTVVASMGHIRSLEEDLDAIGLDRDFEPRFQFLKEKSKAISHLQEAARGKKQIFLAADDDREGEAIAYSVALLLKLDPATTPRAVFHEITESAVKRAISAPRHIDMNRVYAQQTRSVLDMMVGFTISPLLWKSIGPALSAGRCQTPALRLICERERAITSFTSQTTWKLTGSWRTAAGFTFQGDLKDELEDKESAINFLENIHTDAGAKVLSATTKQWSLNAPKPLITSTYQQEASALYKCAPKRSMQIAQKLYEAGHITYMRTDHAILSEEAVAEAAALIKRAYGDSYLQQEPKKTAKQPQESQGKAQEAHEAIRPTHFDLQELPGDGWDSIEQRIYKLIWNRAVQSIMTPARGDERTVTFLADGDPGEFPWESKWRRTTFLGWKKIGAAAAILDEAELAGTGETTDSPTAIWIQAVGLVEGTTLSWSSLEAFPVITKAQPRFNEATLVRELEKKGIGRPSTYASLVETLFDKKYSDKKDTPAKKIDIEQLSLTSVGAWPPKIQKVQKMLGAEKDKMVPSPLGLSVLDFCVREFPQLFEYDFTAQMENRLDKIAQGKEAWKQLCRDIWSSYKDHYSLLKKQTNTVNTKLREFGDGIKAVMSKKGPLILKEVGDDKEKTVFYGWPSNIAFQEITKEQVMAHMATGSGISLGEYDGHPIVEKKGTFGRYAEWKGIRVTLSEGDTLSTILVKLGDKKNAYSYTLGDYEFRKGKFGTYMFKKSKTAKKPVFVGLPEGLDPATLTLEAAARIYTNGCQANKKSKPKTKEKNVSSHELADGES